jgi:flavin reductase (DIM6/NTAB) family NADH-FMN oxidoreductase RutF
MFKNIATEEIKENVFKLIDKDWMLVTAGNLTSFNTMTASWGGLGELWNKRVAFCFIRPQRYTYEFMEIYDDFTLSFFPEQYREALQICGKKSGRNIDKMIETGLIPYETKNNAIGFQQAKLIFECKKLYFQDIDPKNFLDEKLNLIYPIQDYHRMYIGEITNTLVK